MNEGSKPRDPFGPPATKPMPYEVNETFVRKQIELIAAQRRQVDQREIELDHELIRFNERFRLGFFDSRLRQEYMGKFYSRLHQIQLQKQYLDAQMIEKQTLIQQLHLQKDLRSPPPVLTPPLTPQSVASSCPEENIFPEEKANIVVTEKQEKVNTEITERQGNSKTKTKPSSGPVFIDLTEEGDEDEATNLNEKETASEVVKEKALDDCIEKYFAKMGNDYVFVPTELPDLMEDLGEVQFPSPSFDQMIKKELNHEPKKVPEQMPMIKQESDGGATSAPPQRQQVPTPICDVAIVQPSLSQPAPAQSSRTTHQQASNDFADDPSEEKNEDQVASTPSYFMEKENALRPSVSPHKAKRSKIYVIENPSDIQSSSKSNADINITPLNKISSVISSPRSSLADNESQTISSASESPASPLKKTTAPQPVSNRDRFTPRPIQSSPIKNAINRERQGVSVEVSQPSTKQPREQENKGKRKHEEVNKKGAQPPKKKPTVMSDCQKMFVAEKILKKKMQKRSKEKRVLKTNLARRSSSEAPSDLHANATRSPLEFSSYEQRCAPRSTESSSKPQPCKDFERNFFEVFNAFEAEYEND